MAGEKRGWTTHVGHDISLGDTGHRVLDIFFDESAEPNVLKCGGRGVGVGRTVFPKFDDLVTEDKANRQEMHGTGNGR